LDLDAPGRRGGAAGAAVAVDVNTPRPDAVLAGFARLPYDARGTHKVQRCSQTLLFELHVDHLQGDCEHELGLCLVSAGHPHEKGRIGLGVILTILTRIDVTLKALATDSLKFVCMAWSKPSTLYGISNPTSTKIVG